MFGWCLQAAQKLVDSFNAGNEELNHLDPAEVDKVQRAVLEKQEWLKIICADIEKLELTSDPPVLAAQFTKEKIQLWQMVDAWFNL